MNDTLLNFEHIISDIILYNIFHNNVHQDFGRILKQALSWDK